MCDIHALKFLSFIFFALRNFSVFLRYGSWGTYTIAFSPTLVFQQQRIKGMRVISRKDDENECTHINPFKK